MKLFSNLALSTAMIIGVALSILLGWTFHSFETKTIVDEFNNHIDRKVTAIEREIAFNFNAIFALKAFFDASNFVSTDAFKSFANEILDKHPTIEALEWIPNTSKNVQSLFEQNREIHYPGIYVAQSDMHNNATKHHLISSVKRLNAIQQARAKEKLNVTPSLIIPEGDHVFFAIIPLYKQQENLDNKQSPILTGFVLGAFNVNKMINSHQHIADIDFTLIDNSNVPPEKLYSYTTSSSPLSILHRVNLSPFGGRNWSIEASPTQAYLTRHRSFTPYIIAAFGIVFVFIGTAYGYLFYRRNLAVEKAVTERTYELNLAKKELEKISLQDGLTGIANRRHFDMYIRQEWANAIRNQLPISIIMVDIDYFKQFNDYYGHLSGDKCLKQVAKTLEKNTHRASDLVARYGGEEFAIILPNTFDAQAVAESCRMSIEELAIPHAYSKVAKSVTISIGFSSTIPKIGSHYKSLLNLVDEALYQAKASGRNKSCS